MAAPVVTSPTPQTETQGDQATFTVSATGDTPFTYQWYEDTLGYLLNEGADTLIVDALLMNDGNGYYCIVTDVNDLQTQSDSALLTVTPASSIAPVVIGPQSQTVNAGALVSLNVTASGANPFTYQWYLATGGVVAGATGRTLAFVTKPIDNGKGYRCVVTDVSGLVTSSSIAYIEVIGTSLPGNAAIDYPCQLPGVLVNSNAYQSKDRVRRNDLSTGVPLFILKDDDGYEMFNVAWSFDAAEVQAFRNWFRFTLVSGSRQFNIDLWVDGFDGIKQTRTHECYFDGTPKFNQVGRRWSVSAVLIAEGEKGTDECLYTGPIPDLSSLFPEFPEICPAYYCDAVEYFVTSNSGWPMTDPEISLTPPADGYYRGGVNSGPNLLQLTLPTTNDLPPTNLPDWDSDDYHVTTGFNDAPDYCVIGAKFAKVRTPTLLVSRCRLFGAGVGAETLSPDFTSTHILIGDNDGSVLIESIVEYYNDNNSDYFFNMRASAAVDATGVVIGWQAYNDFKSENLGIPPFDINKPYVITVRIWATWRAEVNGYYWDEAASFQITGFGGSLSGGFTDTDGAFFGTRPRVRGSGEINLFRGSPLGVNSLGVLYGDHHDEAWIAVQRNYSDTNLPPECR